MAISRRAFLGAVATAPFFARTILAASAPRVAVVGAGAFGGWTALHLRRLGCDVTLIDAWGPGNTRASSGGETRVIRAIYGADRIYVELVKRAYAIWEQLDPSLYTETGALWLHRGGDDYVRSSLAHMKDLGFPVDQLAVGDAKKRYPQIDFNGIKSVWLERRAGVLSARRACGVVRDKFLEIGGTYRTQTVQPDTKLDADVVVYACGPWLGRMFPEVPIRPTRQEVFYFGTPGGAESFMPGKFPVWIDFGERIVYGIPDIHGRGFKISDDTRGEDFDPTNGDRTPSADGANRARRVLAERFPEMAKAPLLAAEVCQYENSPDGHLIIDKHPQRENAWVVGGGSGHGFKLGPAVGEIVAHAIRRGAAVPKEFSLARLKDATKPRTQFDRKN